MEGKVTMEMKLKQKYTGGRSKKPVPKVVDTTGRRVFKPTTPGKHPNFERGGLYGE
jgi:hypothetical protein